MSLRYTAALGLFLSAFGGCGAPPGEVGVDGGEDLADVFDLAVVDGCPACTPPQDVCNGNTLMKNVPVANACCQFTIITQFCDSPPPSTCSGGVETDYAASGTCSVA